MEADTSSSTRGLAIAERPARRSVSVECCPNAKKIACQPEHYFQELPLFIQLPV